MPHTPYTFSVYCVQPRLILKGSLSAARPAKKEAFIPGRLLYKTLQHRYYTLYHTLYVRKLSSFAQGSSGITQSTKTAHKSYAPDTTHKEASGTNANIANGQTTYLRTPLK